MLKINAFKKLLLAGAVSMLAHGGSAFALCGDVSGDGEILNNDVIQAARASIGALTLDAAAIKRADVALPGGTVDGEILNNDVIIIARKSIGVITGNLVCNESITPGSTFTVPIHFTGNGAGEAYKGFQVTVAVAGNAGASLTSNKTEPTNSLTWNTCRMNPANGKVLCVDTATRVSANATTALALVEITVPTTAQAGQQITLSFSDGLAVNGAGTTSTVTNLASSTLTYTVSSAN